MPETLKERRARLTAAGKCRSHWNRDVEPGTKQCKVCLWRQQEQNLRHFFGITIEEYARMELAQDRKCAICGLKCTSGRDLAVDHNHKTGQVRGLLCGNCNQAVGKFRDSPELAERAAHYLRSTSCPSQ